MVNEEWPEFYLTAKSRYNCQVEVLGDEDFLAGFWTLFLTFKAQKGIRIIWCPNIVVFLFWARLSIAVRGIDRHTVTYLNAFYLYMKRRKLAFEINFATNRDTFHYTDAVDLVILELPVKVSIIN